MPRSDPVPSEKNQDSEVKVKVSSIVKSKICAGQIEDREIAFVSEPLCNKEKGGN